MNLNLIHDTAFLGTCLAKNIARYYYYNSLIESMPPWNILFNPYSILKEIERLKNPIGETSFLGKDRLYHDRLRNWISATSEDELREKNQEFDLRCFHYLSNKKYFFISFGHAEIWTQYNSNLYYNTLPKDTIEDHNYEGFSFHFLTKKEIINICYQIIEHLKNLTGIVPIVTFCVCPVPSHLSLSGYSFEKVNKVSKNRLVYALQEVSSKRGALYFPAYEMTTFRNHFIKTTQADGRHLNATTIQWIGDQYISFQSNERRRLEKDSWVYQYNEFGKRINVKYED